MDFDPRTWGLDKWSLAIAIAGLLFAFVQPFGFLLQWRKDSEDRLEKNAKLRANWAAQLRSGSAGTVYRNALSRALDWLDRVFGPPGSAQALGVCFLVAVAYAWVTFFVGWGFFGGSGGIGGFDLPPNYATQPWRAIGAVLLISLPIVSFFTARWLARRMQACEQWLLTRLLKFWPKRLRLWGFDIFWRFILVGLAVLGLTGLYSVLANLENDVGYMILTTGFAKKIFFPCFGILAGYWVSRFFTRDIYAVLAAFVTAGIVMKFAIFLSSYLTLVLHQAGIKGEIIWFAPGVLIIAMAFFLLKLRVVAFVLSIFIGGILGVILGIDLMIAIGTANSISETGSLADAFDKSGDRQLYKFSRDVVKTPIDSYSNLLLIVMIKINGFISSFILVNLIAQALGAIVGLPGRSHNQNRVWAGGFGVILYLGVFDSHTFEYKSIIFLLFFFILPLLNSLFDWLSWWATRALGQRLLKVLEPARSFWRRLAALLGHGFADLAAAVALLLLMAFALGLGFQAYNDLAVSGGDKPPFDLPGMIAATAQHPWREGFWLTLMLLTTLLPTFGHGIMLLGSPLGLMLIPDRKRLELADELELYNAATSDEQADIRYHAARWHVQERLASWVLGGTLFFWLLFRFWVLVPIGLADWAAGSAKLGVQAAGWLVGAR